MATCRCHLLLLKTTRSGEWHQEWWEKIKNIERTPNYIFIQLFWLKQVVSSWPYRYVPWLRTSLWSGNHFILSGNWEHPHPPSPPTFYQHNLAYTYTMNKLQPLNRERIAFWAEWLKVDDNVLLLEYFNMYKKVILTLNKYFKNTHIYNSLFSFQIRNPAF